MARSQVLGDGLDPDAIASTASGNIWLSPALVAVVPPDEAWKGLRELHYAAIGDVSHDFETAAGSMLPDDARAAYSSGLVSALGQIAVTEPEVGDRLLGTICDAVDLNGGFQGLEGPALSAYLSAGRDGGETPAMQQTRDLFSYFGAPDVLGGGYASSAVVDAQNGVVGLINDQGIGRLVAKRLMGGQGLFGLRIGDVVRDGTAEVLEFLGVERGAANDLSKAIGSAAEGAAGGALIGAEFAGVGAVPGAIIGAVWGFIKDLFGSHDDTAQQQAGRDLAAGNRVAVQSDIAPEINGERQVVSRSTTTTQTVTYTNPDGTTTTETRTVSTVTTAPPHARDTEQSPPQSTVPRPSEVKCQVADGVIPADFAVPYWTDRAQLLGSVAPLGPGRDALITFTSNNAAAVAMRLTDVPRIDDVRVLVEGGLVLGPVYEQLIASGNALLGQPRSGWIPVSARLGSAPSATTARALVAALQDAGFAPEQTVAHVLRTSAPGAGHDYPHD